MDTVVDPGMATVLTSVVSMLSGHAGQRKIAVKISDLERAIEEGSRGNLELMAKHEEMLARLIEMIGSGAGISIGSMTIHAPMNIVVVPRGFTGKVDAEWVDLFCDNASQAGKPQPRHNVFGNAEEEIAVARVMRHG